MIFRGTQNGFKARDFHRNCDNQGATLILIKSEACGEKMEKIFGAYTDIPWKSAYGYFIEGSANSFLFIVRDDKLIKIRCTNKNKEVLHQKDWLCCFGNTDL